MTPTTTDLRTMLDAVHSPWTFGPDFIGGIDGIDEPCGREVVHAILDPDDARLISLAPDLAAEVIRLREAFERLIYEHEAEAGVARDQGNRVRERDLRTIANHLRALLEDQ